MPADGFGENMAKWNYMAFFPKKNFRSMLLNIVAKKKGEGNGG